MSLPNTLNSLPVGSGMKLQVAMAIRGGALPPPDTRLLRVNVPPSCPWCAAGVPHGPGVPGSHGSTLEWWRNFLDPRFQLAYLEYLAAIAACQVLRLEGASEKETADCNTAAAEVFHAAIGIWPTDYIEIPLQGIIL